MTASQTVKWKRLQVMYQDQVTVGTHGKNFKKLPR